MLRHLLLVTGLAFALGAHAGDAGKVIFVAGKAQVAERSVAEGMMVQEGELLSTGSDGFIYVKTIDNGLFILRPNTKARIVSYHVDTKDPANTRIKLELLSGVARSKSGDAVKLARQNFRFNTPVAAIGVRGTDFTVFTDNDTSRVAVISGGVIVSGFAGACLPEGGGPCEGAASRELSATQRGQLLQVQRGKVAPQLLQGSMASPDQVSPPRTDEPTAKAGSGVTVGMNDLSLDAKKTLALTGAKDQNPAPVTPPVTPAPPVTPPVGPSLPERGIIWGRWLQVNEFYAQVDLTAERERSELVAINGNFALFRTPGVEYVAPVNGTIGFAMRDSNAFVYTDYSYDSRIVSTASLSNGKLNVDFGRRTFDTSLDLLTNGETVKLQAQGAVTSDGRMYGDAANGRMGYMNVQGLLSNDKGGSASYLFDGRLDALRTVNGGTYWQK
jgi:hypothetical protein